MILYLCSYGEATSKFLNKIDQMETTDKLRAYTENRFDVNEDKFDNFKASTD